MEVAVYLVRAVAGLNPVMFRGPSGQGCWTEVTSLS